MFLCPFFLQNLNKFSTRTKFRTPKGLHHDALTNAYIQCVENKVPFRKAAKLYNIPHTTLRDRLSDRVHIDTLLLHIETVLFPQFCILWKLNVVKKPILKLCFALILSFWVWIVWRHSLGGSRLKPKWRTSIYHVYLSFGSIVGCWFGVRIYPQSNAKMMHK